MPIPERSTGREETSNAAPSGKLEKRLTSTRRLEKRRPKAETGTDCPRQAVPCKTPPSGAGVSHKPPVQTLRRYLAGAGSLRLLPSPEVRCGRLCRACRRGWKTRSI